MCPTRLLFYFRVTIGFSVRAPWRFAATVVFFQVSDSGWVPRGRGGFFCFLVAHGLSFPVDSSPFCWSISLLALRLAGICIYFFEVAGVRLVPYQRDLGWWLFLLASKRWTQRFFFAIANPARGLCTYLINKALDIKKKKKKKKGMSLGSSRNHLSYFPYY